METKKEVKKVEKNRKGLWIGIGVAAAALLIFLFYLAAFHPAALNFKFSSYAVALGMIGAVAVGIERVIEMFWTLLGLINDREWPLGHWGAEYQKLVANLDTSLDPLYQQANQALTKVAQAKGWAMDNIDLNKARDELKVIQGSLDNLKDSVNNDQFQSASTAALKGIASLQRNYPDDEELNRMANIAGQAVDGAINFVSSFKENPGRRLISIYIGMLLGLCMAWVTGLDVFQATLGAANSLSGSINSHLGVAFTGLVLGLGASPTHEVIQLLKEAKIGKQQENL